MKRLKYRFSILAIMVLVVSSCSIKEGLTDEEVLALDKSAWNFSIQLYDPISKKGVEGATFGITIDGEVKTFTSNSAGIVEFSGSYADEIYANVSKDGYFDLSRNINLNEGDRSQSLYRRVYMLPSGDEGTFTIKGKVTVQSDLTTETKEPAVGASFTVDLYSDNDFYKSITVKADESGNYSVKVPAMDENSYGGYFIVRYPDYTISQKVAINRLSEEPSFPETLPSVATILTTFSANYGSVTIPSVQPIYATVPAPTGVGGVQAPAFRLWPDGTGGVNTGLVGISSGTGYSTGDKPLTIVSIVGGTGAVGVIRDTNANGVLDQYEITNKGTAYPITNNGNLVSNEYFSYTYFHNNSYYGSDSNYRAGSIIVNDFYLGTGVSRVQDVQ